MLNIQQVSDSISQHLLAIKDLNPLTTMKNIPIVQHIHENNILDSENNKLTKWRNRIENHINYEICLKEMNKFIQMAAEWTPEQETNKETIINMYQQQLQQLDPNIEKKNRDIETYCQRQFKNDTKLLITAI